MNGVLLFWVRSLYVVVIEVSYSLRLRLRFYPQVNLTDLSHLTEIKRNYYNLEFTCKGYIIFPVLTRLWVHCQINNTNNSRNLFQECGKYISWKTRIPYHYESVWLGELLTEFWRAQSQCFCRNWCMMLIHVLRIFQLVPVMHNWELFKSKRYRWGN